MTLYNDLEDIDFKDTMKKRAQKVGVATKFPIRGTERPMAQIIPILRSRYACGMEAHESTKKHIGQDRSQRS